MEHPTERNGRFVVVNPTQGVRRVLTVMTEPDNRAEQDKTLSPQQARKRDCSAEVHGHLPLIQRPGVH